MNKYASLEGVVKAVFSMQAHQIGGANSPFSYYANGSPGILFQQSENGMYLKVDHEVFEVSELYIFGQPLKPVTLFSEGAFKLVIIQLYPDALKSVFGLNPEALVDECIDFEHVKVAGSATLLDTLKALTTLEAQVNQIADYLTTIVPEKGMEGKLAKMYQQLEMYDESFKLSSLSDELGMSQRSFQRLFKEYVGFSPRTYIRISRFNKALNKLETGDFKSLTDLAHDAQYADQAHFTRTFKEFTGLTPKEYLSARKPGQ